MSDLEIAEFKKALRNGRWGSRDVLTNVVGQSMISVDVPPWMTRRWNVQLLNHRYTRGVLSAGGQPPDNQTTSAAVPPMVQARIVYGIDGASETAIVDYPWSGCSFNVNASNIRVYIDAPGVAAFALPPIVGVMISPVASADCGDLPTLSTGLDPTGTFNIAAGGTTLMPIPARATAYQMIYRAAPFTSLSLIQQSSNAGGVNLSFDSGQPVPEIVPNASNGTPYASFRSTWIDIIGGAQRIFVRNDDGTNTYNGFARFRIDMG